MLSAPCIFLDDAHAIVLCPYCSSRHKHGSGVLGTRAAHCGLGEYAIAAPLSDVAIMQAIKQYKAKIESKRAGRAHVAESAKP
jgi:hypothetical protein